MHLLVIINKVNYYFYEGIPLCFRTKRKIEQFLVSVEHNKYCCFPRKQKKCFILIIVQRDATQSSLFIILQVRSTCFGCQPHPSSGVHRTVTTASGTGHIFCAATYLQWPVPEAVVTVLCTPDDGCGWHPKHVEWTCRIINWLLCVVSHWTIINIDQWCMEP